MESALFKSRVIKVAREITPAKAPQKLPRLGFDALHGEKGQQEINKSRNPRSIVARWIRLTIFPSIWRLSKRTVAFGRTLHASARKENRGHELFFRFAPLGVYVLRISNGPFILDSSLLCIRLPRDPSPPAVPACQKATARRQEKARGSLGEGEEGGRKTEYQDAGSEQGSSAFASCIHR